MFFKITKPEAGQLGLELWSPLALEHQVAVSSKKDLKQTDLSKQTPRPAFLESDCLSLTCSLESPGPMTDPPVGTLLSLIPGGRGVCPVKNAKFHVGRTVSRTQSYKS